MPRLNGGTGTKREKTMPHYVVVQLILKDAEVFAAYRAKGGAALAKHGGQPIAGGPEIEVLEDTGAGPSTCLIVAFPDAEAARAWINDPELAEVHAMRRDGAQTTILLLPPIG
jgi:uncharacterized protein (DUF1330 family)